jgi:hypothetical protein
VALVANPVAAQNEPTATVTCVPKAEVERSQENLGKAFLTVELEGLNLYGWWKVKRVEYTVLGQVSWATDHPQEASQIICSDTLVPLPSGQDEGLGEPFVQLLGCMHSGGFNTVRFEDQKTPQSGLEFNERLDPIQHYVRRQFEDPSKFMTVKDRHQPMSCTVDMEENGG